MLRRTLLASLTFVGLSACTGRGTDEGAGKSALTDPASATATAPDDFRVKLVTTKGDVVVEVHRNWAPHGADRFYNLVQVGFFDDVAFFRAIEGFMVQFGMHGDPKVQAAWNDHPITDDPVVQSNRRGMLTFAKKSAPDSRTTQVFINYVDNANLDAMGFAPLGEVVEGMDVLDALYKGYGEGAPRGTGPDQIQIESRGNAYLRESFPELDYVKTARVMP